MARTSFTDTSAASQKCGFLSQGREGFRMVWKGIESTCLELLACRSRPRLALKLFLVALMAVCLLNGIETKALSTPFDATFEALPKEQIFGAEIQYFRLRGGLGRNIPRAKVIELWAKALDAAKGAGMNMVSFYIPWDFHEPVEGKFDFDGTTDEDGDGNPDYPSRDVKTFIRMIKGAGVQVHHGTPGPVYQR